MLVKLLKYDFKWETKIMVIYYIIAFSLAILTRFVETLEQTTIVTIIDKILVGTLISCFFAIAITSLIRIWVRFRNGIYKDESYLTHTLPVKKSTVYNAKMISAYLTMILAFFVIISSFFIVTLNNGMFEYLKYMFDGFAGTVGKTKLIFMIISLVIIVFLEVIFMMQAGIFGIIVGNRGNNYKNIRAVLTGIISYTLLSGITLLVLYLISTVNPTIKELFTTDIPSIKAIEQLTYFSLGIYLVYDIVFYFAGKKLLQKGVNVD